LQSVELCLSSLLNCFCQVFLPVPKVVADTGTECALQGVGQEGLAVRDAVPGFEDGAGKRLVGLADQGIQPCAVV